MGKARFLLQDQRLYAILLCCAVVLFLLPLLLNGGTAFIGAPTTDGSTTFFPFRVFANSEIQDGRLPLWNPGILSGTPFHAEGEGAVFYPPNLILSPLPAALSLNWFALLHLTAAGLFLYLYLATIGIPAFPAFLGSWAFVFSSEPVSRLFAGHYPTLPNLALLPALLLAWEVWRRRGGAAPLVGGALAYGCLILAGHPQMLFTTSLFVGWYMCATSITGRGAATRGSPVRNLAFFSAALACGVAVGAIQLFPTLSFVPESFRSDLTYEFASSFSFPPENFLTLLAPGLFGGMEDGTYWGRNYLWESRLYLGVFPLALAAAAVLRPFSQQVRIHALSVLIFSILALGSHTPLFPFLFNHVPGFDLFRGHSKFILYPLFSLCVLSACGARSLLGTDNDARDRTFPLRLAAVLGSMLGAGLVLLAWFGLGGEDLLSWRQFLSWRYEQGEIYARVLDPSSLTELKASWHAAARSLARLVVLSAAGLALLLLRKLPGRHDWRKAAAALLILPELWLFCRPLLATTAVEDAAVPEEMVSLLAAETSPFRIYSDTVPPNWWMAAGIESVTGYTSNILGRSNNFLTSVSGQRRDRPMITGSETARGQVLRANVRYLLLDARRPVPPELARPVHSSGGMTLYRTVEEYPRAYFSRRPLPVPDLESALRRVESGRNDLRSVDLVESGDQPLPPLPGEGYDGDEIRFLERTPNRIRLAVKASGDRLLVLTDAYEKNWRCRLDGEEETAIFPVNIAFRGVFVPEGTGEVEFFFLPRSFTLGAAVSGISLLLLLTVAVANASVRRKGGRASVHPQKSA